MNYFNVDKNLNFVLSEDKKYSKDDLIKNVKEEFIKSGIKVIDVVKLSHSLVKMVLNFDEKTISVIMYLKNITGAGWKDKPKFKRVQVSNLKFDSPEFLTSSKNTINLIMGYYNFDENPIIVCWDAYRYLEHNTVRSCYVTVDSLKRGYIKKYYEGVDSGQKLWIFEGLYSKHFFNDYLLYLNR